MRYPVSGPPGSIIIIYRARFEKIGSVDILISIRPVGFIFLTGGVLTPPCPTPLKDGLRAGLIGAMLHLIIIWHGHGPLQWQSEKSKNFANITGGQQRQKIVKKFGKPFRY
jgi:hypothetical protein